MLYHKPLKTDLNRVRITVVGDRLTYAEDAGSSAVNLLETKVLINSTISDAEKGAEFMTANIIDYFLATPRSQLEYMKDQYQHIPEDMQSIYNLYTKVTAKNYIYIRIKKGVYGFKQAAILAYGNLKRSLLPFVYAPVIGTVGVWKHDTCLTTFYICVDIKYHT